MVYTKNDVGQRNKLIIGCLGLVLGLCMGTVFKNYQALQIFNRCNSKPNNQRTPFEIIGLKPEDTTENSQKNLVFVGVMTAKKFIKDRARAVYDTWGQEVPGRIAFFSSEGSYSDELPVIDLKNVDDRYPPQKKSFTMLYYMYMHYIDKFEWFIRADDDVYIEPQKLERFLRSMDSSKALFIGQSGHGRTDEIGKLFLEPNENYCLGGPAMILSRETLRRVAPHIKTCLKNLHTTHEDVELGRCIRKFVGIPCTWNTEMADVFRNNYSGPAAFTGKLRREIILHAITLHPLKQTPLMYRLHAYVQGLKAEEMRGESLLLHRDIKSMTKYLEMPDDNKYQESGLALIPNEQISKGHYEDFNILAKSPGFNKFIPNNKNDIQEWSFISGTLYSNNRESPAEDIDSTTAASLQDIIEEVMEKLNHDSRQKGRILSFKQLYYGYTRLNAVHGHDMMLNLVLLYDKYRGKKVIAPVRRHIYVQRSFTGVFIKEFQEDVYNTTLQEIPISLSSFHNDLANSKIVFVLPMSGRLQTFERFLEIFERVALHQDGSCKLLVVIFGTNDEIKKHQELLKQLKARNKRAQINFIHLGEQFSRGIALDTAVRSSYIQDDHIVFFIDVDMVFKLETLQRIRMNTVLGKQVYFPIVFSQYAPKHRQQQYTSPDEITNESGYFRHYGFGMCAMYKADILADKNIRFDKNITGWGLEDADFFDKIVENGKQETSFFINTNDTSENDHASQKLTIFRAPDPSLVHIYHDINCDINLEENQYMNCLSSKANSLGSTRLLHKLFFDNTANVEFIRDFNSEMEEEYLENLKFGKY